MAKSWVTKKLLNLEPKMVYEPNGYPIDEAHTSHQLHLALQFFS